MSCKSILDTALAEAASNRADSRSAAWEAFNTAVEEATTWEQMVQAFTDLQAALESIQATYEAEEAAAYRAYVECRAAQKNITPGSWE